MKHKGWIIAGAATVALVAYFALTKGTSSGQEIEYRYAPVAKGELLRSASAVGVLVPLTTVDIKSKAGGTVEKLLVEEGDEVKAGDAVALIDPRDTQAIFDQAKADSDSAAARVAQAENQARLQALSAVTTVQDAEIRVKQAQIALERAKENATAQPALTDAEIRTAKAGLVTQQETLRQLKEVDFPARRREASTNVTRTKADFDAAKSDLDRQNHLYERGIVAKSAVERSQSGYESARAAYDVATQRQATLEASIKADLQAQEARVRQAEASLNQASTRSNQITIAQKDLAAAVQSLEQAKVAAQKAKDDRLNVESRKLDVRTAQSSAVRSKVAVENARVQLDSTKVVAPRDGIVTMKYLEEGTIIPPGTSTFSQGTSIVQIADVSRMFVDCTVDEADIASIRKDQRVLITIEAYPGRQVDGKVIKVFPAAMTDGNLTNIKVRVEIEKLSDVTKKLILRPGMNATCEFVQHYEESTLVLPQAALKHDGDTDYVLVKSSTEKPEKRVVKVGETGNEGIGILEGLKEGEEVVIAEIDLASLRDRLQRMEQAQQPGGLGSQNRGGPSQSRRTGASPGGGGGGGMGR